MLSINEHKIDASKHSEVEFSDDEMADGESFCESVQHRDIKLLHKKLSFTSSSSSVKRSQLSITMRRSCEWILSYFISTGSEYLCGSQDKVDTTFNATGAGMIEWGVTNGAASTRLYCRGIWQIVLDEGLLISTTPETDMSKLIFVDDAAVSYQFEANTEVYHSSSAAIAGQSDEDEENKNDHSEMSILRNQGFEALLKCILSKSPGLRTSEELDFVFKELTQIAALSRLSSTVKQKLAEVVKFESYASTGTILFKQGDQGFCWYVIFKGSVHVSIKGKGVVTTLYEGDDFGDLALVNDAPRAATIITREANTQFLRVDKDDFNIILRDVEDNTVRLKEAGKTVLILENVAVNDTSKTPCEPRNYVIKAGTSTKIVEHLVEKMKHADFDSGVVEDYVIDFFYTYVIYLTNKQLTETLERYLQSDCSTDASNGITKGVACSGMRTFCRYWVQFCGTSISEDPIATRFLTDLHVMPAPPMLDTPSAAVVQRKRSTCRQTSAFRIRPICAADPDVIRIYLPAKQNCRTVKTTIGATVTDIIQQVVASSNSEMCGDAVLCEVTSSGRVICLKPTDRSVSTKMSVNGRLFFSDASTVNDIVPHEDQKGLPTASGFLLEESVEEVSRQIVIYDWELLLNINRNELLFYVFGRTKFSSAVTPNLDLLVRRLDELQYWVSSEICTTQNISKRVALLKKFIILARHLLEYNDLNAFYAIVFGLVNRAVDRLLQTWERLPSKYQKLSNDFKSMLNPSRNHRIYRQTVEKLQPPIVPFIPIITKDLTFAHEGNPSLEGTNLINFEEMRMISRCLQDFERCRSLPLNALPQGTERHSEKIRLFVRNLKCIDNQSELDSLSQRLEPK